MAHLGYNSGYLSESALLTAVACKNALAGERDRKIFDASGLYLLVRKTGGKSWRMKYQFGGKEKLLTIGPYPLISLTEARSQRDAARLQLAAGIDPAAEKAKRKRSANSADGFESAARAWHAAQSRTWGARYSGAVLARLEAGAFKAFGGMALREVTAPVVLEAMRAIEGRGAHSMAHRTLNHVSEVFVWAIGAGLCEANPAATVGSALKPADPKRRPAAVTLPEARGVLTAIEATPGALWSTLLASRLTALTAARPGNVRLAEKEEFADLDGEQPVWRIPAEKLKLSNARKRDRSWTFTVPLSRQAAEVARLAIAASPSPRWLFPGSKGWRTPISDATLPKLYAETSLPVPHVPHGWRAAFSTIMNERAALAGLASDREIIELMLAHVKGDVEAAYNRAAYLPRRREIAQEWADLLLVGARPAAELLPEALRPEPEPASERGRAEARRKRVR